MIGQRQRAWLRLVPAVGGGLSDWGMGSFLTPPPPNNPLPPPPPPRLGPEARGLCGSSATSGLTHLGR